MTMKHEISSKALLAQKIKQNLIRKASIKKSYAKIKEREILKNPEVFHTTYPTEQAEPASLELHPDRQAMLEKPEVIAQQQPVTTARDRSRRQRHQRSKKAPFEKEARMAQQNREEVETTRSTIEEKNQQRQHKTEERERFRKAMAKARVGGKNGQRKLGRESKVLLEKVKRVVNE